MADMSLATYRSIWPSSSRSAATTPSPRPVGIAEARTAVTSTNRPRVVAEDVVGQGREVDAGRMRTSRAGGGRWQGGGCSGSSGQVVANVEIEVAVAVEVGEGRRRRPVAIARPGRRGGDVLERAVALVAVERIRLPASDEQVGMAVVVDSRRRSRRVRIRPESRRCRTFRDVLERAVAPIAKQPVALPRGG